MPLFKIEDTHSGFKLLVEGDQSPTEKNAESLVKEEFDFLSTNIFKASNNRFMLDVGSTSGSRRFLDSSADLKNRLPPDISYVDKAWKRVIAESDDSVFRGSPLDKLEFQGKRFPELLEEERKKSLPKNPKPTDIMLNGLPDNSLMLVSHGDPEGGLYSDEGQRFTLHNLATVLGQPTNSIRNIYNLSCYGGLCKPEDFRTYFPNVTNLIQTPKDKPNTISIDRLKNSKYFSTNITPNVWQRIGDVWKEKDQPLEVK